MHSKFHCTEGPFRETPFCATTPFLREIFQSFDLCLWNFWTTVSCFQLEKIEYPSTGGIAVPCTVNQTRSDNCMIFFEIRTAYVQRSQEELRNIRYVFEKTNVLSFYRSSRQPTSNKHQFSSAELIYNLPYVNYYQSISPFSRIFINYYKV